jgi:hypothetical protein
MRLLLILATIFLSGARASEKVVPLEEERDVLTRSHDLISLRLVRLADQLDSFFGETRADDEINKSSIRINHGYTLRMEKDPLQETNFRINLRLKNLENLFKFSVEKNEKAPLEPTLPTQPNEPRSPPLRSVEDIEAEPWRFRMDAGLNASIPPNVFARSRLRKNWNWPWVIQRFTEELTWSSELGWIQTTTLFHDKQLSPISLLRFTNEQNWQISEKRFQTSHGPTILQNLTEHDALSYSLRVQTTVIDSVWANSNYQVGLFYRRNLKDFWLFGEIGPAIDFPRMERFRRAPSILFRIETFFSQN